jgi:hypothetical protein
MPGGWSCQVDGHARWMVTLGALVCLAPASMGTVLNNLTASQHQEVDASRLGNPISS